MEKRSVFQRPTKMYQDLLLVLENIELHDNGSKLESYEKALMEIDESLRELKSMIRDLTFDSVAEEIYFFKEIKPLFVSQFIYYSTVLAIEVAKPNAGQLILQEYYEYELKQLKNFVHDYHDFYEYYRRRATYLDAKYFVRQQFDFKMSIDPNLYNYDEKFTTSHDYLVAQIIANDRLEHYLLRSIYDIEGYFFKKFSDKSPLTWSSSKSGLVEVIYALHVMRCFNGGNIELSELTRFIEKTFNVDLGNIYKTLHEIKNRKTGQTKFLQALTENLQQHFDNTDS